MFRQPGPLLNVTPPMILVTDVNDAPSLWQPVLEIGPKGYSSIEFLQSSLFLCLTETTDATAFIARWRPLIHSVMEGRNWDGGPWYHQERLERHALGFANPDALMRPVGGPVLTESVQDLYKAWAKKRLAGDEDNLAAFCNFLTTKAGAPLRLDGLLWIADALSRDSEGPLWYRDRTSAAFIEFLTTMVTENGEAAVTTQQARQALIDLTSIAVSRQLQAALAVQDRLKALL